MNDMKIKHRIADLMNDVQLAADPKDTNVFDDGYIKELTKHDLNDW